MFNTRQLKIGIIIFIAFILTSCADDKVLKTDIANEIQEAIGQEVDIGRLEAMDSDSLKSVSFISQDENKDGTPKYETKFITDSVTDIQTVTGISNFSVFVTETINKNGPNDPPHCNDIESLSCNIIKIDHETIMICEKTLTEVNNLLAEVNNTTEGNKEPPTGSTNDKTNGGTGMSKIIELPNGFPEKLAKMAGKTVDNISFLRIEDLKGGRAILLLNLEDYEEVNFDEMRDCVGALTHVNSTSTIFYKGSCCSATTSNGNESETCRRRC